jgi:hypothetical protein
MEKQPWRGLLLFCEQDMISKVSYGLPMTWGQPVGCAMAPEHQLTEENIHNSFHNIYLRANSKSVQIAP